ncbi:tetratricopeptide repeat protein [Gaetbulibacter aestuarii]|uniref:Tetratricopeptide repeat protein n=1 Tax=Gaetbulibacter aestuarii TaxID=1502358 RepID=A0ABW7MUC7_9FLAO
MATIHNCYIYNMKSLILICCLMVSLGFAQEDRLAQTYFDNGDYAKAALEYEKLYSERPNNINYIEALIDTYQQLEEYKKAEDFINKLIKRVPYPGFYVYLGHNYQLQGNQDQADFYYDEAIKSIETGVNNVYGVTRAFKKYALIDQTISVFEKAMEINPDFNFNLQLAQLYGEKGDLQKMFDSYLDFADKNPVSKSTVKRALNDFISEDPESENNQLFRKTLLKKMQQTPKILWNEMLSWLFIQQKEYNKAFIQEKAIFKRQPENLFLIEDLADIAADDGDTESAKGIYKYLSETAQDVDTKLNAEYHLLQLEVRENDPSLYESINKKYTALLDEFGRYQQTLRLQIAYAHFLAFHLNKTEQATKLLETALDLPLREQEKAEVKMELGDILVLEERFNKALIYFTQIQRSLKNSEIAQEARFKVAKTSYYKGDFKWAEAQLNILKASTSQLMANDALELKLMISDNKYEDSTQTALKLYAKADLRHFQNKPKEAVALLDKIINEHKTEPIVAQALYKQAQLFEAQKKYSDAANNYQLVIDNYRDGILADDALYHLAKLYDGILNQPEKAKTLYEQILFDHADSIYLVEARKRYRAMRGDLVN